MVWFHETIHIINSMHNPVLSAVKDIKCIIKALTPKGFTFCRGEFSGFVVGTFGFNSQLYP